MLCDPKKVMFDDLTDLGSVDQSRQSGRCERSAFAMAANVSAGRSWTRKALVARKGRDGTVKYNYNSGETSRTLGSIGVITAMGIEMQDRVLRSREISKMLRQRGIPHRFLNNSVR